MIKRSPAHIIWGRCFSYAAISLFWALFYLYMVTSGTVPAFFHFFYPFGSGLFGALAVYTERLYDLQSELKS